jgi:hypothetical protein
MGRSPRAANPAARVTACCSHIPTSKIVQETLSKLSQTCAAGIAAVMAMILLSVSASLHIVSPKCSVKLFVGSSTD